MRDGDAGRRSLTELHERHRQVISSHKMRYEVMQVVELTGLSWPAVRTTIDLYEADGAAALRPKERGRKKRRTGLGGFPASGSRTLHPLESAAFARRAPFADERAGFGERLLGMCLNPEGLMQPGSQPHVVELKTQIRPKDGY